MKKFLSGLGEYMAWAFAPIFLLVNADLVYQWWEASIAWDLLRYGALGLIGVAIAETIYYFFLRNEDRQSVKFFLTSVLFGSISSIYMRYFHENEDRKNRHE